MNSLIGTARGDVLWPGFIREALDLRPQLRYPCAGERRAGARERSPGTRSGANQAQRMLVVGSGTACLRQHRAVRFRNGDDVGGFHDAALDALQLVSPAG